MSSEHPYGCYSILLLSSTVDFNFYRDTLYTVPRYIVYGVLHGDILDFLLLHGPDPIDPCGTPS